MASQKTATVVETPEPTVAQGTKPGSQAYKCVHPYGLEHNGSSYKTGQRYAFTEDDLLEGGWVDSQIKAKLFEPVE